MPRTPDWNTGYAAGTEVPIERSRSQIEGLLRKHAADGFHSGWKGPVGDDPGWDAIEFVWKGQHIRFRLARPRAFTVNAKQEKVYAKWAIGTNGLAHREAILQTRIEGINRQRWRVLFLVIKAKLEAVEAGVSIFEEEFLAHIVTANDKTVGEIMLPMIAAAKDRRISLPEGRG